MNTNDNAPAVGQQGAENQAKVTDFLANAQLLEARINQFAEVEKEIQSKVSKLEEQKKEVYKGKSYQKILIELLSQIKAVDFRQKAGLDAEEKITRKQQVVIFIDELLNIAIANNWGLCTKDGFIYVFNGKYWQTVSTDDFKPFLAQAAIQMGIPAIDAKYHLFKDELHKQFLSCSNLPTLEVQNKVLINLLNGTFEITDGIQGLREEKREDFMKYQLPFEYDPNAKCPLFLEYLNRVLPDEDCQKVLAEYIGYLFTNGLKLEKALILYGGGANGKSVFFEVINAILGEENICSYSLQSLTKDDSYQRAELSNKLVNYASEINGKLEASNFKLLVSGEPIQARQIYGRPFTMRNYGKLIFNCNELPRETEQTNAFFRRFTIIPFTVTIPESEQDPELAKKIISNELGGVFNWILEGLKRIIHQKKFTQSVLVNEEVKTYRKESDSVAIFVDEENYIPAFNENIPLKLMYGEYKTYCYENGYRACSIRTLSERLKMLGFESKRKPQGNVIYAKK